MNQHIDSVDNSSDFESYIPNEEEVAEMGQILFSLEASIKQKENALHKLAHVGTEHACKILEAYKNYPDEELRLDAEKAYDKGSFFLFCASCEDDSPCTDDEMVFTGIGKYKNMMRIYYMVLPVVGAEFEAWQHDIICREMSAVALNLQCEGIEWFDYQPHYVGFSLLQSPKVSMSKFIETGIAACNGFGEFVFPHYYAGSGTPKADEIDEIIFTVREGDEEEDD